MSATNFASQNQLLTTLVSSSEGLLSSLEEVLLTSGEVIHRCDRSVAEIYFPQTAICSLIIEMSDKSRATICLIGCEGAIGLPAIFGSNLFNTSCIVQISGTAIKLPLEVAKREFNRDRILRRKFLLYTQARLAHTAQAVVCNSLHNIEQRLARLLLLVRDGSENDTLPLTQKSISLILGVRRASITEAAIVLQKQQIVRYSRGKIKILDRQGLEAIACECHTRINSEYQRLLNSNLFSQIQKKV